MKISKLLPQDFSTRLIMMIFISGFIPIVIFGMLISIFGNRFIEQTSIAIQQGQDEQWQRSQTILEKMAEDVIRQKALDVALHVELYLKAHPELSIKELQNDPEFREIAIQTVGKSGYTAIHDSESGISRFHKNPKVENTDLHGLAQELPEFWSILAASLNGRYSHGHYSWKDIDGAYRDKFMYIAPINTKTTDGIRLNVGATAYIDEFTRSIKAAQDVSQGITHLLSITINKLLNELRVKGFLLMGVSIVLVLFLASWTGLYFSRAIKQLRRATQAVNQGDFDVQLHHAMTGDAGRLVDDFNQMVSNLTITTVRKEQLEKKEQELQSANIDLQQQIVDRKKAEKELNRYQGHLEDLVVGRTKELTTINSRLQEQIEERKQVAKALQLNEQRMKAILQASPVGIGLVIERQFKWVNDTMYQLLGHEHDSLLNKNISMLYLDTDEYERVGRELYPKGTKAEIRQVTTQWIRKDWSMFDCTIRGYPLDPGDPEQGVIIAVTDISEAMQLEVKLQQAQKMEAVGTLAGGVAHDLNNILSGIVTYPELILLDLPAKSPLVKPLLTIKKSGEKATAVVQDLLTMARRGVAVAEIVNLNTIITSQLVTPEFQQLKEYHPNIKVITVLDEGLLNLRGSEPHLAKTFMNLISNAAEAMTKGGVITITTAGISLDVPLTGFENIAKGEYVTFSIADKGVGLSKKEISRIFEPFYTTKKMGRSGSGLGMAVVWGTVKDHKGYIDIVSSEQAGSVFTLYFPASHEELKKSVGPFSIEKYQGDGELILVVDDSREQREIAKLSLEKLHYMVVSCRSGEDAVQYLKQHSVDLVMLDMIMEPGIDGLDTYRQISRFKPGQKVIIASGFSENERVKEVQGMSGCLYIKKPYTLEGLGNAIKKAMHKKQD